MRRILLCLFVALALAVLAVLLALAVIAGASLTIWTMICVAIWTAAAMLLGAVGALGWLRHKLMIAGGSDETL